LVGPFIGSYDLAERVEQRVKRRFFYILKTAI